ncbi:ComEC/Rec2 family competence protein [Blastomonas fulva]|uniref:ComEC/Rec2 family competence protein n=1 Tax=Blastomonas fulva TaxID=1550728 RepID=UPI003F6FDEEB
MLIEIHDVDHGGCAVITGPSGHRLMLDCGLSYDRSWFPSVAHAGERIDTLMLLNLDEDHCEDLHYLIESCSIGAIVSNPTVTAKALQAMKAENGMRSGVKMASDILERFGTGLIGDWNHGLGGVQWTAFWNGYGVDFTDTNNLSLAVFVQFGDFTILFGGDLERAGWRGLLKLPAFRAMLPKARVLVASHHGRENGCCDEIFDHCHPQLVILSDGSKQHETQETNGWYARRAIGIPDYTKPASVFGQPRRKVMTTRCDGNIMIGVGIDGNYVVVPSKRAQTVVPRTTTSTPFNVFAGIGSAVLTAY